MRKTASYLNTLRRDVQTILDTIEQIGSNLDAGCHDLSRVAVHDVKTDPGHVNGILSDIKVDQDELINQLKLLHEARNKYLEFF
jgi:hypothetical protein